MNTGMLWYDNDPKKTLETKVREAAAYFANKYGGQPTMCYVNPKSGEVGRVGGVEVRTSRAVHPNHLWIGIDQTEEHRA